MALKKIDIDLAIEHEKLFVEMLKEDGLTEEGLMHEKIIEYLKEYKIYKLIDEYRIENHKSRSSGLTKTRLYRIWKGIRNRCYNKQSIHYDKYGGAGVRVCREWDEEEGFYNFLVWSLNNGYADNLTIDRINVYGNYEPSNCRWADMKTQGRNRTISRIYSYQGNVLTLSELSNELSVPESVIKSILYHGGNIEGVEIVNN